MLEAVLIRTPTDFERAMNRPGDFMKVPLVSPPAEIEPAFREALDGIFQDLEYIDSAESGMVATYLEGIAKPLDELHRVGCAIFAVVTQGTISFPDAPPVPDGPKAIRGWYRTYYLVIPVEGVFRVGLETGGTVHRFSPQCTTAVRALAKAAQDQTAITVWGSPETARQSLELRVAWCQDCCLDQLGGMG